MEEIRTLTNQQLIDFKAAEIMKFILDNPEQEISIMERLKNNAKTKLKWININNDIKSAKLNPRGAGAIKAQALKDIGQNIEEKDILILNVNEIKANPGQPRKIFNENKLIELSESIKTHGLLQPIVVTKNTDGFTLIAGERRLRAHKLANIKDIKAIVIEADEIKSRNLAIIENLHRDDLSPVEEGISYLELQKTGNFSLRDLEDIVKKNKNYIAARLNLTKFDDDCLDFILKQELKNVSKLLKILETESTNHKMLLEKLSKNDLSNEDIEKFKVNNIKKLPDEKIEDKKSSKPKEVDHDKFNEDSDFSKDKKEAQVEAISEKVRNEEDKKDDLSKEEENIIEESPAIKITGIKGKRVNISIDVENMTGRDFETLKEFISTL